jgi:hypothetical protein
MVGNLLTYCKSTILYRPPCTMEFPVTGNVDHYYFTRRQCLDDGTNLQQGGQANCQALVVQQQAGNRARR